MDKFSKGEEEEESRVQMIAFRPTTFAVLRVVRCSKRVVRLGYFCQSVCSCTLLEPKHTYIPNTRPWTRSLLLAIFHSTAQQLIYLP
jgi:hypothetical protein